MMIKNADDLVTELLRHPETTPERLLRIRRRLGHTQEAFGIFCGVNTQTVRDAERQPSERKRPLTLRTLERIRDAVGVPVEDWIKSGGPR